MNKSELLSILCIPNPFVRQASGFDLLIFGLGSFVIISILLLFYKRISRSTNMVDVLDNPIYQAKDILLQSNNLDVNLISTQSTTSIWVKAFVFILIAFVVVIPVDQLFSVVNSFY